MTIKYNFFGTRCVIDRSLSDHSQLELGLKDCDFNFDNIVFVNQVHSSDVVIIDAPSKIHARQNLPKADAIVTNLKNLVICVVTADCAPILFCDAKAGVIAAVHAGWRGAKSNIIHNAVIAMNRLGASSKNIHAFVGPMIHANSYQVGQDFFENFLQENSKNKTFFTIDKSLPSHYLFDLPRYVINKIKQEEINNIRDVAIDTYMNNEHYASYRKAKHGGKEDCGRNISAITLQ